MSIRGEFQTRPERAEKAQVVKKASGTQVILALEDRGAFEFCGGMGWEASVVP